MLGRNKPKEEAKEHDEHNTIEPKESGDASTSLMFQKLQVSSLSSPKRFEQDVVSDFVKDLELRLKADDPNLTTLNLKKKELNSIEKKIIFKALAVNNKVTKADFSAVEFSPEDAKNFAEAFSVADNNALKLLILNYNGLGDDGIESIVRANLHLDKIVAMCCEITDIGAEKVAHYAKIPDICLNQNYITKKGYDAMAKNPIFSELTFMSLEAGNLFQVASTPSQNESSSFKAK